jgi:alpha-methylacyl-CoA racemase
MGGLRPLDGVRVVDLSALGPAPFGTMILADFGADVVAVERPRPDPWGTRQFLGRGKRSVVVDLKQPQGVEVVARLAAAADVFVESSRPGVMEAIGLGPDVLLAAHPGLVYARLTGWGQTGPYAERAGHDINYIAVGGPLGIMAGETPVPPANLVGDFAAGSLLMVVGILLALRERDRSGHGQVVDAAMVDGAALLSTGQLGMRASGLWGARGTNFLDGSAPFYGTYRCADGRFVSVGAIEPAFWAALLQGLDLDDGDGDALPDRDDPHQWPALRSRLAERFAARTRDEWMKVFDRTDACVWPVLDLDELADDPHLAERRTVTRTGDGSVAAPAPRLSRTPGQAGPPTVPPGEDTAAVLAEAGYSQGDIDALRAAGAVGGQPG